MGGWPQGEKKGRHRDHKTCKRVLHYSSTFKRSSYIITSLFNCLKLFSDSQVKAIIEIRLYHDLVAIVWGVFYCS